VGPRKGKESVKKKKNIVTWEKKEEGYRELAKKTRGKSREEQVPIFRRKSKGIFEKRIRRQKGFGTGEGLGEGVLGSEGIGFGGSLLAEEGRLQLREKNPWRGGNADEEKKGKKGGSGASGRRKHPERLQRGSGRSQRSKERRGPSKKKKQSSIPGGEGVREPRAEEPLSICK